MVSVQRGLPGPWGSPAGPCPGGEFSCAQGAQPTGERCLQLLKETPYIRLGGSAFLALWENQKAIPENWKEPLTFFAGSFQSPNYFGPLVFGMLAQSIENDSRESRAGLWTFSTGGRL